MPKKNMTPEERKAFGEKMKAARQAKKQSEKIAQAPPKTEANADIGELLKQINELKDNPLIQAIFKGQESPQPSGTQVTNRGLIGTFEKYITDPQRYPSPVERLKEYMYSKPQLSRIGFNDNYELEFQVVRMRPYERRDGVMETQPQFTLKLNRIVYDPETYEPTEGRFEVATFIFFEDPETALVIARDQNLEVDETNEKAFLDEMRFIRMRDWLTEAFYPAPISGTKKNIKEMVDPVSGKLKKFFEVSSETAQSIDFNQLQPK